MPFLLFLHLSLRLFIDSVHSFLYLQHCHLVIQVSLILHHVGFLMIVIHSFVVCKHVAFVSSALYGETAFGAILFVVGTICIAWSFERVWRHRICRMIGSHSGCGFFTAVVDTLLSLSDMCQCFIILQFLLPFNIRLRIVEAWFSIEVEIWFPTVMILQRMWKLDCNWVGLILFSRRVILSVYDILLLWWLLFDPDIALPHRESICLDLRRGGSVY